MHRLYIALPVPESAGIEITTWARSELVHEFGRVLLPDSLHLSIAFFANANADQRSHLIQVVQSMIVKSLKIETAAAVLCRHGALALDIDDKCWRQFYDQFLKWPGSGDSMKRIAEIETELGTHDERGNIPHITFARIPKHHRKLEFNLTPTVFRFELNQVCLYESHLGEGGSRYEILAESSPSN
jgi:2'-5' RNA ligase